MSTNIGYDRPTDFLGQSSSLSTTTRRSGRVKSLSLYSSIGFDRRPDDLLPLSPSPSPHIDPTRNFRRCKVRGLDQPQDYLPLTPTKNPLRGGGSKYHSSRRSGIRVKRVWEMTTIWRGSPNCPYQICSEKSECPVLH
jgi:hypothetical protein